MYRDGPSGYYSVLYSKCLMKRVHIIHLYWHETMIYQTGDQNCPCDNPLRGSPWQVREHTPMGLLPDRSNRGCACAGNAGNIFPATAGKRSRHASRHVRDARAVMHAGIANFEVGGWGKRSRHSRRIYTMQPIRYSQRHNIGCQSETHVKYKFRYLSLANELILNYPIVLKF